MYQTSKVNEVLSGVQKGVLTFQLTKRRCSTKTVEAEDRVRMASFFQCHVVLLLKGPAGVDPRTAYTCLS